MIYIATVHWKDDRWIKLQRKFIERYIDAPFQVYAYLTDISSEFYGCFDHVRDQDDPSHPQKLNLLAQDIVKSSTDPTDLILFMDGDAFPIAPITQWIKASIADYPLIAVQRLENIGDIQPHPCFCVTTIALWQDIKGDWSEGYQWRLENNVMQTDVGGNLLEILENRGIPWLKMHRTNTINLDDLLFGVYEDIIYHHGAGFRPQKGGRIALYKAGSQEIFRRLDVRILEKCIPKSKLMSMRFSVFHPYGRMRRKVFGKLTGLSDRVYQQIMDDNDFVYTFIKPLSAR